MAITDLRAGSLVDTDGIDLAPLLAAEPGELSFAGRAGGSADPRNEWVIRQVPADIVVEATYTNPTDGEPALSHVRWALESGKHVCTTNKGPVALAGQALKRWPPSTVSASSSRARCSAAPPSCAPPSACSADCRSTGVQGIMNGTSNYILGRLEEGLDLPAAIAEAQELGYAEADPTADIEGHDVQLKVMILANEVLGADLRREDVPCEGISGITPEEVQDAASKGLHWKLVGSANRHADGRSTPSVAPLALPAHHPLAGISGAGNAVAFDTDLLGTVTVSGPGAGRIETAYALLSDIIAIHERHHGRRHRRQRARVLQETSRV